MFEARVVLGRGQGSTQGRQVAEQGGQHFIALKGAEQVGDEQVEGLAVALQQFFPVVALGQLLHRPQQRQQHQGQ